MDAHLHAPFSAMTDDDALEALRRERDHLQILVDVTNAVLSTLEFDDLVEQVARALSHYLHIPFADLNLFDAESSRVESHAALFRPDGSLEREQAEFALSHLPARDMVMNKQVLVCDAARMRALGAEHRHVRALLAQGFHSLCVLPLFSGERILGALMLAHGREAAFFHDNLRLLQQIAARIALSLDNALAYQQISQLKDRLARENRLLTEEISNYESFDEIIGQSVVMSEVLEQVRMVADTDSSVLIQGETGTGKELIARAIHNLSPRKSQRMVTMNSAAIPAGLLESELFGHEKGAFTGASAQRLGRFELAHQGTLFLDEVGDIPLELQPKLLRVLQEREIERLGGQKIISVDVRVIAATSCDLSQMIAEKRYRSDLYYRLNVFPIWVPPLRDRPEDIPLLARFFAQKFARRLKRQIEVISDETLLRLSRHPWPGNVRELQNVIERAVILSRGPELHLPMSDLPVPAAPMPVRGAVMPPPLSPSDGSESERDRILRVLRETNGIVAGPKGAAARLGLKRTTLLSRMQRMGISVKSLDEL
ncbi:MAG: sigma 54-interacting transcriptional regulator [Paludibacterium sp.]|uniref:sigma 54-interacting transcriptional regulator n=1 Tax=Paludibacterium sp. TaxID=1917523 RepID=UPI0025CED7B8|nr:sigma 54-interacting transcriptional regulator [Paludibacterium sp.]MBV8047107.1 sigma 54-interacting transcriptional regulator [Paludibacterium sp.]MBV8648808.1 sigma 54-interacting transcriptional regulator [Paludibacterium sp.]